MIRNNIFILLITFLTVIGCSGNARKAESDKSETRIFTDMAGRDVEIPSELKKIFIDRHSTLMFYSLDTVRNVNVGFRYSDTEKHFLKKSFYGDKPYVIEEGSHEEMIALNPDIILWSQRLTPDVIEKAENLQKKLNIPVVLMDMDIHNYKEIMKNMAMLLGREEKSEEIIGFIEKNIDPIPQKVSAIDDKEKKKIYYAEGMNGLATDPQGSIHSLLIDLCGGVNIAESVEALPGKGMSNVSLEQVYKWNPEYILVWSGNFDSMSSYKEIMNSELWSGLDAVKANNIYQVPWRPFGWIDRPPGMNRLIGYLWLSNLLYPDVMNIDIVEVSREFFKTFYHYDMSVEDARNISNPQPALV